LIGKGIITDLSLCGIKFESNNLLEEDEYYLVSFFLPGSSYYFNIKTRIARRIKNNLVIEYGMRFFDLNFLGKIRIWLFVVMSFFKKKK
jgi:hypothetical protein